MVKEFRLHGHIIAVYTIAGSFQGEEQATKELLAYEHGCKPDDITVTTRPAKRTYNANFIKTMCKYCIHFQKTCKGLETIYTGCALYERKEK